MANYYYNHFGQSNIRNGPASARHHVNSSGSSAQSAADNFSAVTWYMYLQEICSSYAESSLVTRQTSVREFFDSWRVYGSLIREAWLLQSCEDDVEADFYQNWPDHLDQILPLLVDELNAEISAQHGSSAGRGMYHGRGSYGGSSAGSVSELDQMRTAYLHSLVTKFNQEWQRQRGQIKDTWRSLQELIAWNNQQKRKTLGTQTNIDLASMQKLLDERRTMNAELDQLEQHMAVKEKQIGKLQDSVEFCTERNRQSEQRIHDLQQDKDSLLSKLARLMNTKISADESDLEDIGTRCRPAVITEEYEALCSNDWLAAKCYLDAESSLTNQQKHVLLTTIIMKSSESALNYRRQQENTLKHALVQPALPMSMVLPMGDARPTCDVTSVLEADELVALDEIMLSIQKFLRQHCASVDVVPIVEDAVERVISTLKGNRALTQLFHSENFASSPIYRYVTACCKLAWKMSLQRPVMVTRCEGIGHRFDDASQELNWGSAYPGPDVVVGYYVNPTLLHGECLMKKGKIMLVSSEDLNMEDIGNFQPDDGEGEGDAQRDGDDDDGDDSGRDEFQDAESMLDETRDETGVYQQDVCASTTGGTGTKQGEAQGMLVTETDKVVVDEATQETYTDVSRNQNNTESVRCDPSARGDNEDSLKTDVTMVNATNRNSTNGQTVSDALENTNEGVQKTLTESRKKNSDDSKREEEARGSQHAGLEDAGENIPGVFGTQKKMPHERGGSENYHRVKYESLVVCAHEAAATGVTYDRDAGETADGAESVRNLITGACDQGDIEDMHAMTHRPASYHTEDIHAMAHRPASPHSNNSKQDKTCNLQTHGIPGDDCDWTSLDVHHQPHPNSMTTDQVQEETDINTVD